jgi:hypothetical protein
MLASAFLIAFAIAIATTIAVVTATECVCERYYDVFGATNAVMNASNIFVLI